MRLLGARPLVGAGRGGEGQDLSYRTGFSRQQDEMRRAFDAHESDRARTGEPLCLSQGAGVGGLRIHVALKHQNGRHGLGRDAESGVARVSERRAAEQLRRDAAGEQQFAFLRRDHVAGDVGTGVVLRCRDQGDQGDGRGRLRALERRPETLEPTFRFFQLRPVASPQACNHIWNKRPGVLTVQKGAEDQFGTTAWKLRRDLRILFERLQSVDRRPAKTLPTIGVPVAIRQDLTADLINDLRASAQVPDFIGFRRDEGVEMMLSTGAASATTRVRNTNWVP